MVAMAALLVVAANQKLSGYLPNLEEYQPHRQKLR